MLNFAIKNLTRKLSSLKLSQPSERAESRSLSFESFDRVVVILLLFSHFNPKWQKIALFSITRIAEVFMLLWKSMIFLSAIASGWERFVWKITMIPVILIKNMQINPISGGI